MISKNTSINDVNGESGSRRSALTTKTPPKKSFEESAEEIQDVCQDLVAKFTFYGIVIASLNRILIDDDTNPNVTLITPLDMYTIKLEFNYRLWENLTFQQKVNRVQHEVLHFVFLHPWQDKPSNLGFFYTATDLEVNKYCEDEMSLRLDNFRKLENKYNFKIDREDGWVGIYNSLLDLVKIIPSEIMKKHNHVKEDYEAEMKKWGQLALQGKFFDEGTTDLNEAFMMLPQNSKGNDISGLITGLNTLKAGGDIETDKDAEDFIKSYLESGEDKLDPWKTVSDQTSDSAAKDMVKSLISRAQQAGSIPGGMENYIEMLFAPPKVDWKKEVRNFTKKSGGIRTSTTMSRRNKRFGTFPAMKITRTQRLAFIGDTSGSMTDKMFQQILSEINSVLQSNCEIVFIQADAEVDDVTIYKKKIPPQSRIIRNGYGGTSFDDALEYVKTKGKLDKHSKFPVIGDVDGVVYVTDGYASAPKIENYPRSKVLWLTTEKPKSTMENEGFRGKIVEIHDDDY